MVRRCCVPTCRNSRAEGGRGAGEEGGRVSYFKAPGEPRLYEHWARTIAERAGGELCQTSVVCERHFLEDEVRREAVLRDSDGNVIFQKPLIKYYLKKNVVPSIFDEDFDKQTAAKRKRRRKIAIPDQSKALNNTENFTIGSDGNLNINCSNILGALGVKQNNTLQLGTMANNSELPITPADGKGKEQNCANHAETIHDTSALHRIQIPINITGEISDIDSINIDQPREITIFIPEEEIMVLNQNNTSTRTNNVQKKKSIQDKRSTIHYPLPESEIQMNIRTFDLIYHNSQKIKLPNPMWGYHKNSIDKNIIIFSKAKWFKSDVLIPPIYEKQVVFHESDSIKIYINSKFSPLEVRRPRDLGEMELILRSVDETAICTGGPSIGECETVNCAQKDHAVNRWRHKLCPIVVAPPETTCKFCLTVNQVLRYPKKKRFAFGRRAPAQPEEKDGRSSDIAQA